MKYRAYPEYKDSGVKWIDKIPANWKMEKSKHIFKKMNRPPKKNDGVVTAFRDGIVTLREKRREEGFTFSIKEIGYQGIRKGDLVIHGMDGFAGAIGVSDSDGKCSPVYSICLPIHKSNTYYYAYILREMAYSGFITSLARGIRERSTDFRFPVFKELILPVPSFEEQQLITLFLSRKIKELDETIQKDSFLIEFLNEKRDALINHAVTKGLDDNVKMKDSGNEWIKEIPEGWEIDKIKNRVTVLISNVDKKIKENEPDVLLCNYTDVYNNEFITSKLDFMKATASIEQIKRLSLKKSDVIITKDSESAEDIAVPALVKENLNNVVCGYHLALLRPNEDKITGNFLFRLLQSKKINHQFYIAANGVTRFGISTYPIKNSYIAIPPLNEQNNISNYLDIETLKIDKTVDRIKNKIDLLNEYKKSLIHHVVTGKVDVRGDESLNQIHQKKDSKQTSLTI